MPITIASRPIKSFKNSDGFDEIVILPILVSIFLMLPRKAVMSTVIPVFSRYDITCVHLWGSGVRGWREGGTTMTDTSIIGLFGLISVSLLILCITLFSMVLRLRSEKKLERVHYNETLQLHKEQIIELKAKLSIPENRKEVPSSHNS